MKIAVMGMLNDLDNTVKLLEVKELLRGVSGCTEVLGFRDLYIEIRSAEANNKDTGEVLDDIFEKFISRIEDADALLVVVPERTNLQGDEMRLIHCSTFVSWAGFITGYAWSIGMPTITYSPEDIPLEMSPMLARGTHANLYTEQGLKSYDWNDLPTSNAIKVLM